jgi:GTP-binding protein
MNGQGIRNVAIVAHVDHGKTTLVDHMLRQAGAFRVGEELVDRVMDSGDLERERGITILAKCTSVMWKGTKINVIDTPGHADFGGEVERTLTMADAALLLVDAAEGPLPGTRFVLSKCLARGFPVIVVINKVDRRDARADEVLNEVFDLFCDLEATPEQLDFPVVYAVGKEGRASSSLPIGEDASLEGLLELIVSHVPSPMMRDDEPLRVLVSNIEHDDYVGRLAVGRVVGGAINVNQPVGIIGDRITSKGAVKLLMTFDGIERTTARSVLAGDIVAIGGIECIDVGDTITDLSPGWEEKALERISVEPPTIRMSIGVNSSPLAGACKASKFLTSRQIRERLVKETRRNLAVKLEGVDESTSDFQVLGRGELQLAILIETMRREGYEMQLGNPEVVLKDVSGTTCEPYERAVIDVPEGFIGIVTELLGRRGGRMVKMANPGFGRARLEYLIPSRGLIGFRGEFLTSTRGTGLLSRVFESWEPYDKSTDSGRQNGALVADREGVATPYALDHLQSRGRFFLSPGAPVYEGMVVGESSKPQDIDVNAVKEKKLSNVRNHGKDENTALAVPTTLTIETAMEWIGDDELVEVTPEAVRVRKRVLRSSLRPRKMS